MMKLKVAVQMDPIARINVRGDSTFALLLEAQKRGYALSYYTPEQLSRTRRVIGLMSGTSADGIDAALLHIQGGTPTLEAVHREPLPGRLARQIRAVSRHSTGGTLDAALTLDMQLGTCFARARERKPWARRYQRFSSPRGTTCATPACAP